MELAAMSLRQKVGQMIQAGFDGLEPNKEIVELIEKHHLGGVILFARNVKDIAQVADLTHKLQLAALRSGHEPLWISIDQEGGMVARITEGVALMPGQMAIAAGGSVSAAYDAANSCGKELRALGINMNFAPDLDVNVNPDNPVIGVRSFGESPQSVAAFGAEAVRGLQDAGVAATAKHFPGHGDTSVDSHLDLPTISHSRERIYEVELYPFQKAIEAGVDAVMSSHIVFPAFESRKLPATLSHSVLTGLLREELGFRGVIVTDCMEMQAISDHYGTVQAAVMAVEAGADCILISHRHELQVGAIEAIVEAVESGRISEERIDRSVERLLALKKKRLLSSAAPDDLKLVGCPEHRETARAISEASITLVKDEKRYIPLLQQYTTLVIQMEAAVSSIVDESIDVPLTLGRALGAEGIQVVERTVPASQAGEGLESLVQHAEAFEQIVIGTYNASFHPDQVRLVKELQSLGKRLIVVALRNPYDVKLFPDLSTYLVSYESRPLAMQSIAKCLTGAIGARGKLPVTLSSEYPAGWGVSG